MQLKRWEEYIWRSIQLKKQLEETEQAVREMGGEPDGFFITVEETSTAKEIQVSDMLNK